MGATPAEVEYNMACRQRPGMCIIRMENRNYTAKRRLFMCKSFNDYVLSLKKKKRKKEKQGGKKSNLRVQPLVRHLWAV